MVPYHLDASRKGLTRHTATQLFNFTNHFQGVQNRSSRPGSRAVSACPRAVGCTSGINRYFERKQSGETIAKTSASVQFLSSRPINGRSAQHVQTHAVAPAQQSQQSEAAQPTSVYDYRVFTKQGRMVSATPGTCLASLATVSAVTYHAPLIQTAHCTLQLCSLLSSHGRTNPPTHLHPSLSHPQQLHPNPLTPTSPTVSV